MGIANLFSVSRRPWYGSPSQALVTPTISVFVLTANLGRATARPLRNPSKTPTMMQPIATPATSPFVRSALSLKAELRVSDAGGAEGGDITGHHPYSMGSEQAYSPAGSPVVR